MDKPRSADSRLTDGRKAQRRFWTAFLRDGSSTLPELRGRKPPADSEMHFALGRTACELVATHARGGPHRLRLEDHIRIEIVVGGDARLATYDRLKEKKADIESKLRTKLTWYPPASRRQGHIYVSKEAPITNPDDWPNQHRWLLEWLQKFDDVFRPLIQNLDA